MPLYLFPRRCKVATLNSLRPRNPICANTDVSVNEYKPCLQSAFSLDMLKVFLRQHTPAQLADAGVAFLDFPAGRTLKDC